jgi:MFS family permease
MSSNISLPNSRKIIAYCAVAIFLCYEMLLQVSPGVMTKQLMQALHINEAMLGFMSGAYFYTYAAMQLPAGLLFTRYKIRTVVCSVLTLCVTGTLLLATTHHFWVGTLARIIMGAGSAFGFVSVLIVASYYFPSKYFPLLVGIAQMIAAIGAICGIAPLNSLISLVGWQQTLLYLSAVGIILIVTVRVAVPSNEPVKPKLTGHEEPKITQELIKVLGKKQNWTIGCYAFFSWLPVTAFASLWGVPFLVANYAMTTTLASSFITLIWLGIALGSPLLGVLSEKIGQRKMPLFYCGILGCLASVLVIYIKLNFVLLGLLLLLQGCASSGQALSFAVVKDNNKEHESVAIGFTNMAVVITGGVVQPAIGFLINYVNGFLSAPNQIMSYKLALWLIPVSFMMMAIISKYVFKESYNKLN